MLTNFNIFIFVMNFFKYLYQPNILNIDSISLPDENESESEFDDYISE